MPLEDPTTLDVVTTSPTGQVRLVITDAGTIPDPEGRFRALLAKVGTYGHYLRSDAFAQDHPDAPGVEVVVMCRVPPTDQMRGVQAVHTPAGNVPVRFEEFGGHEDASGPRPGDPSGSGLPRPRP